MIIVEFTPKPYSNYSGPYITRVRGLGSDCGDSSPMACAGLLPYMARNGPKAAFCSLAVGPKSMNI